MEIKRARVIFDKKKDVKSKEVYTYNFYYELVNGTHSKYHYFDSHSEAFCHELSTTKKFLTVYFTMPSIYWSRIFVVLSNKRM